MQAACWLHAKRTYMALRPDLRRVYTMVRDLAAFAPVVTQLRFRPLEGPPGAGHSSAVLDLGPGSVDGWLADLAAAELGVHDLLSLDREAGEVVVDGRRVALTPLELGVLAHLHAQRGKVVSRPAVLRDVWATTRWSAATSSTPWSARCARSSARRPPRSRRCGGTATAAGCEAPRGRVSPAGRPTAAAGCRAAG